MKLKKIAYILMATLLLTACGKTDTKENTETKKEETEANSDDVENITDEEQTNTTSVSNSDNDKDNTTESNSASTDNSSNTQTSVENSSTSNKTTQNSSNISNNQTTQKEEVKVVDRIREEVPGAVTEYKYGITQQTTTTNDYYVYSDGTKKLINSVSSTSYDTTNYAATDSQLKVESDSNASKYMSYYQEVLNLVNQIRAEKGVAPLTLDTTLCKAASMRALEMDYSGVFSHTRPNGEDCWTALRTYSVSYSSCGENIAAGQATPAQVVNAWKNSSGHYDNMIDASFTKLGVGYSATGIGAYGHYWCQLFTN